MEPMFQDLPFLLNQEGPKNHDQFYHFCHGGGTHFLHCESGEGLWIEGEAALQTHSFRDAEPHPVIPLN